VPFPGTFPAVRKQVSAFDAAGRRQAAREGRKNGIFQVKNLEKYRFRWYIMRRVPWGISGGNVVQAAAFRLTVLPKNSFAATGC
jgi:hypothetical protein